jgi:hypothetical protein
MQLRGGPAKINIAIVIFLNVKSLLITDGLLLICYIDCYVKKNNRGCYKLQKLTKINSKFRGGANFTEIKVYGGDHRS